MRVLVIAPHADDEVLGAGATIAQYAAEGHTVRVVVLTHRLFPWAGAQRARVDPGRGLREVRAAAHALGVTECFIGGLAERGLPEARQELMDLLEAERDTFRPDLVLLPDNQDVHQDHRATYDAARIVWRPHLSKGVTLLAYQAPSALGFVPDTFVPVSHEALQKKCAALAAYSTEQLPAPSTRCGEQMHAQAIYWGGILQVPLAEAFRHVQSVKGLAPG